MSFGILDLLMFGPMAVAVVLSVLLALVHRELGPAAHLVGHRRWLLAAALGSGVLAFMVKLIVVVTLAGLSELEQSVAPPATGGQWVVSGGVDAHRANVWTELPGATTPSDVTGQLPDYVWRALPDVAPSPVYNPTTAEKVALGQRLFTDPALSRDGSVSCASCHDLDGKAGADGRTTARGVDGASGDRNTPTVWNAAFQSVLFWDGRVTSLEEQAKGPLLNPLEMAMPNLAAVEQQVRDQAAYREAFSAAFGAQTPITIDRIVEAIAAYERTLITPDTAYDRFVRGDATALTPAQLRGMALFASLGCTACHSGPNFSAASVFDTTAPWRVFPAAPTPFDRDYAFVGESARRAWRVPSLRNVALTGPWLHNGGVSELAEVVRIMASAQLGRSGRYLLWSGSDATLREFDLPAPNDQEVEDIVAFLGALSSDRLLAASRHRADSTEPTAPEDPPG